MAIGEGKTTRLLEALEDGGSITGVSGSGNTNLQNHIVDLIGDVDEAKQAIVEKGGTVGDTGLEGLASEIGTISGGGGDVEPLDPVKVYEENRPSDWLEMPETLENGDYYFLLHIPHGTPGDVQYKTRLYAGAETYNAEFGKLVNGVFTPTLTIPYTGYNQTITVPTSTFGDTTSDGFDQVIMRLSGWTTGVASQAFTDQNGATLREHTVEAKMRADSATAIAGTFASSISGTSFVNMQYVSVDAPNAGGSINYMFYCCYSLKAVTKFNFKSTTNASNMFSNCFNLVATPDIDFSNCTDCSGLFTGCYNLPAVRQFNFSNNTNFGSMFANCYKLKSVPEIDTSKGTTFTSMFLGCSNMAKFPQIDTSSGTTFSSMFSGCSIIEKAPQLDLSNGTNFQNMFQNCYELNDIPNYNTSKGTTFTSMFQACKSLTKAPQLDLSNGTNFQSMFYQCSSLKEVPNYNTSKGTTFASMFCDCTSLDKIPILDTSSATNVSQMFQRCIGLSLADLRDWDFTSITSPASYFTNMFGNCGNIEILFGDKFSSNGIGGTIYTTNVASNGAMVRIYKTDGVLPTATNATSVFYGTYCVVYVPDDLLSAYQADAKWNTLGARLKPASEWP